MLYEKLRSADTKTHLICRDGEFDSLPDKIRQLGPWNVGVRGEIQKLKPHYRALLAEQGFVVLYSRGGVFDVEV